MHLLSDSSPAGGLMARKLPHVKNRLIDARMQADVIQTSKAIARMIVSAPASEGE